MKKVKFRTNYNHVGGSEGNEPGGGVSQTVKGQSMTVKEIFERAKRGMLPAIGKRVSFDNPESFDDIRVMSKPDFDLTDLDEEKRTLEKVIKAVERSKAKKSKSKDAGTTLGEASEEGEKNERTTKKASPEE